MKIFTGNAHPALAESIASYLDMPLGKCEVFSFSNENVFVRFEENIRERDVFLVQPIVTPVNTRLMELFIMIDAAKRASAGRITAVVPYYGYGRSDKKDQPRVPITARLIANFMETAGADRLLTIDLHAGQIQGFFDIPVDNLFATPIFARHIKKKLINKNLICVAPDVGGVERTRALARKLDIGIAIIDKRREGVNEAKAMNIIGDVKGKICIVVDDMVDTAGTLLEATNALIDAGAVEVHACCTHPVLSGPAHERIQGSALSSLITTNTIPLKGDLKNNLKIKVLSIAPLLGEAILRIHKESSVSSLFHN